MALESDDRLVDFGELHGFEQFVGGPSFIGGPITDAEEELVLFPTLTYTGEAGPLQACAEGNVVAFPPIPAFNTIGERFWYGLVVGVNEGGGPIHIRPLISGGRLLSMARANPPQVANPAWLANALLGAEVYKTEHLLVSNAAHALDYRDIHHVVTVEEFRMRVAFHGGIAIEILDHAAGFVTFTEI